MAQSLPFIGHLTFARQLQLLGSIALIALVTTLIAGFINSREAAYNNRYMASAGELEVALLNLEGAAQSALLGNADAFEQIAQRQDQISKILRLLDLGDSDLPATQGHARAALESVKHDIAEVQTNVDALRQGRAGLVTLAIAVHQINKTNKELLPLVRQLSNKYAGDQKVMAMALGLAVTNIAQNADLALATTVSRDDLAQLGVFVYAAEDALASLPAGDPVVQNALALFRSYQTNVETLVSEAQSLVNAKHAGQFILEKHALLSQHIGLLEEAYQSKLSINLSGMVGLLAGITTLLMLLLLFKAYLEDSRRRTQAAEEANNRNQMAISRLIDELSGLADGNLATQATVSEDLTGVIANSINHSTAELRGLVSRVIDVSHQVTQSTHAAGSIAKGLLEASQRQAADIKNAGNAVEVMAKSIQEINGSAAQSSLVAQQAREVTERGAKAIHNSVSSMDDIRQQIHKTSESIKRLGVKSQEIGEIVNLISDITEQTNVLALNASMQSATAGEAGRTFAVIAEEVQRLAERSDEAAQQIGLLVLTIQGGTQDAVLAMEKSLQGVLEGAKLSDEAGRSLHEIEHATRELTDLVNSISTSTQIQTHMTEEVTRIMADILKVTEHTYAGTKLTSASISKLDGLANELGNSVSGFKL